MKFEKMKVESVNGTDTGESVLKQRCYSMPLSPPSIWQRIRFAVIDWVKRTGLSLGAIAPEVDSVDALPEFQRGWYEQDAATKKFKLNLSKVEVEDVTGLKNTVKATRTEAEAAKRLADQRIAEALKPFEGIDPVKVHEMMAKLGNDEEATLIAAGKLDEVISRRMKKLTDAQQKLVDEAAERESGALEVASTFMERVLDNHVRAAAAKAGLHPSAIEDALLRARAIFSLNDEGEAVQLSDDDGETPVLGKDGKTPFSPAEWLEGMKETAPHWFPASASGGGASGGGRKPGAVDLSNLSPTARLTAARAAKGG